MLADVLSFCKNSDFLRFIPWLPLPPYLSFLPSFLLLPYSLPPLDALKTLQTTLVYTMATNHARVKFFSYYTYQFLTAFFAVTPTAHSLPPCKGRRERDEQTCSPTLKLARPRCITLRRKGERSEAHRGHKTSPW
jgi:hypothetical protein